MKKIAISLAMLTTLSGCASIIEGSTQNMNINTAPSANVSCVAQNKRGNWKLHPMPASLMVKRSSSPLYVHCEGEGYEGGITERSDAEAWTFTNILWGLIGAPIGFIVDASTGAMFSYNDAITVPLHMKSPQAAQTDTPPSFTIVPPAATETQAASSGAKEAASAEAQSAPAAVPAPVMAAPAPAASATYEELVRSGAIVEAR